MLCPVVSQPFQIMKTGPPLKRAAQLRSVAVTQLRSLLLSLAVRTGSSTKNPLQNREAVDANLLAGGDAAEGCSHIFPNSCHLILQARWVIESKDLRPDNPGILYKKVTSCGLSKSFPTFQ